MSVENTKFDHHEEPESGSGKGPSPTLIGLGIAIALLVVFFFQNSRSVPIHFLFFEKTTTIRWSIIVAVVLGIVIDRVFTIWLRRRRKRTNEA